VNRTTLTLAGAATALAAVTGVAALTAPGDADGGTAVATAERLPVERSTLVCPQPADSDLAETAYTAFTPRDEAAGDKGAAALLPAPEQDLTDPGDGGSEDGKDGGGGGRADADEPEPVLPLKKPGTPVTASTDENAPPALYGSADGALAPGWTVQQTTTVRAGAGRGLHATACSVPDTDFWFPGASTAEERRDYVHLTNPDETAAVVDLELHGKDGPLAAPDGEGLTVPPRSTLPVLLSTLTAEPVTNVAVHAVVRTGRVGAQMRAVDDKLGGDWLPASAVARPRVVLPGIPADATAVRLVVLAPGEEDADLALRLATPSGSITPAGNETLHVKAGMTAAVDLGDLTKGEAGSLVLAPSESAGDVPVVAAVRVLRGKGAKQESAFIPATAPLERRATAADNRAEGSTLSLSAPGKAVKVRVTSSAGSGGGKPVSRTLTVKAGTTQALAPPEPEGAEGTFAVTVERLSGGELFAARTLEREDGGLPAFTVQTLPDDRGRVAVPGSEQDLSVLTR
jgi:hypothetical protein